MLMIRLQRVGKRNNPAYRVVLVDARRGPQSGSFQEILGSYNPRHKSSLVLQKERIIHWISKGAQTSDTMHNLLVSQSIINAPKRSVVPPSKLKKAAPEQEVKAETSAEPVVASESGPEEKIEEKVIS